MVVSLFTSSRSARASARAAVSWLVLASYGLGFAAPAISLAANGERYKPSKCVRHAAEAEVVVEIKPPMQRSRQYCEAFPKRLEEYEIYFLGGQGKESIIQKTRTLVGKVDVSVQKYVDASQGIIDQRTAPENVKQLQREMVAHRGDLNTLITDLGELYKRLQKERELHIPIHAILAAPSQEMARMISERQTMITRIENESKKQLETHLSTITNSLNQLKQQNDDRLRGQIQTAETMIRNDNEQLKRLNTRIEELKADVVRFTKAKEQLKNANTDADADDRSLGLVWNDYNQATNLLKLAKARITLKDPDSTVAQQETARTEITAIARERVPTPTGQQDVAPAGPQNPAATPDPNRQATLTEEEKRLQGLMRGSEQGDLAVDTQNAVRKALEDGKITRENHGTGTVAEQTLNVAQTAAMDRVVRDSDYFHNEEERVKARANLSSALERADRELQQLYGMRTESKKAPEDAGVFGRWFPGNQVADREKAEAIYQRYNAIVDGLSPQEREYWRTVMKMPVGLDDSKLYYWQGMATHTAGSTGGTWSNAGDLALGGAKGLVNMVNPWAYGDNTVQDPGWTVMARNNLPRTDEAFVASSGERLLEKIQQQTMVATGNTETMGWWQEMRDKRIPEAMTAHGVENMINTVTLGTMPDRAGRIAEGLRDIGLTGEGAGIIPVRREELLHLQAQNEEAQRLLASNPTGTTLVHGVAMSNADLAAKRQEELRSESRSIIQDNSPFLGGLLAHHPDLAAEAVQLSTIKATNTPDDAWYHFWRHDESDWRWSDRKKMVRDTALGVMGPWGQELTAQDDYRKANTLEAAAARYNTNTLIDAAAKARESADMNRDMTWAAGAMTLTGQTVISGTVMKGGIRMMREASTEAMKVAAVTARESIAVARAVEDVAPTAVRVVHTAETIAEDTNRVVHGAESLGNDARTVTRNGDNVVNDAGPVVRSGDNVVNDAGPVAHNGDNVTNGSRNIVRNGDNVSENLANDTRQVPRAAGDPAPLAPRSVASATEQAAPMAPRAAPAASRPAMDVTRVAEQVGSHAPIAVRGAASSISRATHDVVDASQATQRIAAPAMRAAAEAAPVAREASQGARVVADGGRIANDVAAPMARATADAAQVTRQEAKEVLQGAAASRSVASQAASQGVRQGERGVREFERIAGMADNIASGTRAAERVEEGVSQVARGANAAADLARDARAPARQAAEGISKEPSLAERLAQLQKEGDHLVPGSRLVQRAESVAREADDGARVAKGAGEVAKDVKPAAAAAAVAKDAKVAAEVADDAKKAFSVADAAEKVKGAAKTMGEKITEAFTPRTFSDVAEKMLKPGSRVDRFLDNIHDMNAILAQAKRDPEFLAALAKARGMTPEKVLKNLERNSNYFSKKLAEKFKISEKALEMFKEASQQRALGPEDLADIKRLMVTRTVLDNSVAKTRVAHYTENIGKAMERALDGGDAEALVKTLKKWNIPEDLAKRAADAIAEARKLGDLSKEELKAAIPAVARDLAGAAALQAHAPAVSNTTMGNLSLMFRPGNLFVVGQAYGYARQYVGNPILRVGRWLKHKAVGDDAAKWAVKDFTEMELYGRLEEMALKPSERFLNDTARVARAVENTTRVSEQGAEAVKGDTTARTAARVVNDVPEGTLLESSRKLAAEVEPSVRKILDASYEADPLRRQIAIERATQVLLRENGIPQEAVERVRDLVAGGRVAGREVDSAELAEELARSRFLSAKNVYPRVDSAERAIRSALKVAAKDEERAEKLLVSAGVEERTAKALLEVEKEKKGLAVEKGLVRNAAESVALSRDAQAAQANGLGNKAFNSYERLRRWTYGAARVASFLTVGLPKAAVMLPYYGTVALARWAGGYANPENIARFWAYKAAKRGYTPATLAKEPERLASDLLKGLKPNQDAVEMQQAAFLVLQRSSGFTDVANRKAQDLALKALRDTGLGDEEIGALRAQAARSAKEHFAPVDQVVVEMAKAFEKGGENAPELEVLTQKLVAMGYDPAAAETVRATVVKDAAALQERMGAAHRGVWLLGATFESETVLADYRAALTKHGFNNTTIDDVAKKVAEQGDMSFAGVRAIDGEGGDFERIAASGVDVRRSNLRDDNGMVIYAEVGRDDGKIFMNASEEYDRARLGDKSNLKHENQHVITKQREDMLDELVAASRAGDAPAREAAAREAEEISARSVKFSAHDGATLRDTNDGYSEFRSRDEGIAHLAEALNETAQVRLSQAQGATGRAAVLRAAAGLELAENALHRVTNFGDSSIGFLGKAMANGGSFTYDARTGSGVVRFADRGGTIAVRAELGRGLAEEEARGRFLAAISRAKTETETTERKRVAYLSREISRLRERMNGGVTGKTTAAELGLDRPVVTRGVEMYPSHVLEKAEPAVRDAVKLREAREAAESDERRLAIGSSREPTDSIRLLTQEEDYLARRAAVASEEAKALGTAEAKARATEASRQHAAVAARLAGERLARERALHQPGATLSHHAIDTLGDSLFEPYRSRFPGMTFEQVLDHPAKRALFQALRERDIAREARAAREARQALVKALETALPGARGKGEKLAKDLEEAHAAAAVVPDLAERERRVTGLLADRGWSDADARACVKAGVCAAKLEPRPEELRGADLSPLARQVLVEGELASASEGAAARARDLAKLDAAPARNFDEAMRELERRKLALAKEAEAKPNDTRVALALTTVENQQEALEKKGPLKAGAPNGAQRQQEGRAYDAVLAYLGRKESSQLAAIDERLAKVKAATGLAPAEVAANLKRAMSELSPEKRAEAFRVVEAAVSEGKGGFASALRSSEKLSDETLVSAAKQSDVVHAITGNPELSRAAAAKEVNGAHLALAQTLGVIPSPASARELEAAAKLEKTAIEKEVKELQASTRAQLLAEARASKIERAPSSVESSGAVARSGLEKVEGLSAADRAALADAIAAFDKDARNAELTVQRMTAMAANPDMFETYRLAYVAAAEIFPNLPKNDPESKAKAWKEGVRKMLKDSGYTDAAINDGLLNKTVACLRGPA